MDAAAPPPIVRLRIERRGGLAGLRPSADCAYAALTAGQRRALHQVLDAGPPASGPPGADRFVYRLRVIHPDGTDRTLDLPENTMPGVLAGLVRPNLP